MSKINSVWPSALLLYRIYGVSGDQLRLVQIAFICILKFYCVVVNFYLGADVLKNGVIELLTTVYAATEAQSDLAITVLYCNVTCNTLMVCV